MRFFQRNLLHLLIVVLPVLSEASDKTVTNVGELNAAVASASGGDTVTLKNGAWSNAAVRLSGKGSQAKPILVRAQTAGQVIFTGNSTLDFTGEWITFDGVKFEGVKTSRTIMVFADGAKGCRLTNSAILTSNSGDNNWVHVRLGTFHRIDHCRFSGMNQPGMGIQFETSPTVPGDHMVDNCLFMDRARGSGNGFETIRIGYSHQQNNLARVTLDRNLFLRCNGENEIVSNKSTGNLIFNNTFMDNSGEFTCRHGDKARIEGNFFLRQDRGIRLIGSDHVVVNNYIADMKSDGIILYKGESNPPPTGYEAANNAILAFNTIVNCPAGIVIGGGGGSVTPKNVKVANNVFLLPSGPVMRYDTRPNGITYEGNIWKGSGAGVTDAGAGLISKDPLLEKGADGIYRPAAGSPLKDAAAGVWADIVKDLDGSARSAGSMDVGAFEIGGTATPRKPLTEKDVGPWWMGNTSGPDIVGVIDWNRRDAGRLGLGKVKGLIEARDLLGRMRQGRSAFVSHSLFKIP